MTDNVKPQDALEGKPEPERKVQVPLKAYKAFETSTTPEFEAILDEIYQPLKQLYTSITYRTNHLSKKNFE